MTSDEDDAFKFLEEEGKAGALSPSLEAILKNARRLLDDACLLYDNERFASATALAILAMEEGGKYFIVKWAIEKGSVARNLNEPSQSSTPLLLSFFRKRSPTKSMHT